MTSDPLGFAPHDHAQCKSQAMSAAESHCESSALQFTPVRRRTLEILLESHAALGAYDILARLDAEGLGSKPPVAYRALNFLVEQGLAHRIERLNAFVACTHPGAVHDPAFMICRDCGTVAEAEMPATIDASAQISGFQVERTVLESEGLCPQCQVAP